ncbi:hypothetical protein ACH5RR_037782 [Cinchona calisaya]|uniref:GAG-pre-integrase domain-containing protein n=1 Tax=Cinchona calisaya TaxID=153742 RepID=A0ABD2Y8I0_9GENT
MLKQVLLNSAPSTALSIIPGTSSWYFDSACSNHMTSDPSSYENSSAPPIYTADGSTLHISHTGNISTSTVSIPNAFLISKLMLNLISVGQLCKLDLHILFTLSGCSVQDSQKGQILGTGRKVGHLFDLVHLRLPSHLFFSSFFVASPSCIDFWHSRLGRVSVSRLKTLVAKGHLGSIIDTPFDCASCQLAKYHTLPFNKSDSISSASFDLVHLDIWGPSPTPTMGSS